MKNKTILAVLIFLFAFFAASADEEPLPPPRADSPDNETDFIVEIIGGGSVTRITGYNRTKTEIWIPGAIRRMPLVAIGDRAFNRRGITSIRIPGSVILIGHDAFTGNQITRITIGANVTLFDDSFDSGFANFYNDNGRRPGTYVFNNGSWSIQQPIQPVPVVEEPSSAPAKKNSVLKDMDPYFAFNIGIGIWDIGPSVISPRTGLYMGLLFDFNSFQLGFSGGGGGFLGAAFPNFEDGGISYGYYFGSFMELFFDTFGIGLGVGMAKGYFTTKNDLGENYFLPYAEINLMLGEYDEAFSVYFRYYFNDSDRAYNKFAFGIGRRLGD